MFYSEKAEIANVKRLQKTSVKNPGYVSNVNHQAYRCFLTFAELNNILTV